MTEMTERVSRALQAYDATASLGGYDGMARAAIAAMREPTQAQYDALSATNKMWGELTSRIVWQTYIDAALSDADKG